nr:PreS/S [Tibetan frog hepatitis B virus]
MMLFARILRWLGGDPSVTVTDLEHLERMKDPHAFLQYFQIMPPLNQASIQAVSQHFNMTAHQGFLEMLNNKTFQAIGEHYYRFRQAYANHSIQWTNHMEEEYWQSYAPFPEGSVPADFLTPRVSPSGSPTLTLPPSGRPTKLPRLPTRGKNKTRPKKPLGVIPVLLSPPTDSSRVIAYLPSPDYPSELLQPATMSAVISPALLFPVVALAVYFLLTKAREILAKLDLWWTSHSFQGDKGECIFQSTSPLTPKHLAGFCPPTCGGFLWTSLRLFIICLIILLAVCGYLSLMEKGFTAFGEQLWEWASAPGTLLSSLLSSVKGSGSIFLSIALLTWMISSYLTLTPTTSMLLLTGLWATYNNTGSG